MASFDPIVRPDPERIVLRGIPRGNHSQGLPTEKAFNRRPKEIGPTVFLLDEVDPHDLRRKLCNHPRQLKKYGLARAAVKEVLTVTPLYVEIVPKVGWPGHCEIRGPPSTRDLFAELEFREELAHVFREWEIEPGLA